MNSTLLLVAATLARVAFSEPDVSVLVDAESVVEISPRMVETLRDAATEVAREVRGLLPELDDRIRIRVRAIDGDLDPVGGVAGWAARPGEVQLLISVTYPGGLDAAIEDGLGTVLFHEFHHLWRGWTIEENRFGPGIPIAVVNEGMAAVFADIYSGTAWDRFDYPPDVRDWLAELLALPLDADYNTWMNDHPDGRIAIGYRTGRYVIHEAMARSGRDIIELGELSPEEILALVEDDSILRPSSSDRRPTTPRRPLGPS